LPPSSDVGAGVAAAVAPFRVGSAAGGAAADARCKTGAEGSSVSE
jgi:hypothetical protein